MTTPTLLPPDLVLRGSLISLRRKCGKPSCHCGKGSPHETPALSSSIDGVTQILTLLCEDLPQVRSALRRYHQGLADLDRRARAGLALLRRQRSSQRRRSRRR
jgi:hypothetical protein